MWADIVDPPDGDCHDVLHMWENGIPVPDDSTSERPSCKFARGRIFALAVAQAGSTRVSMRAAAVASFGADDLTPGACTCA